MRLSLIRILILLIAPSLLLLSEAMAQPTFPRYRSEYIAKLNWATQTPVQQPTLVLVDRSPAETTASTLSLIALPALIGGLLTRDQKALSAVLLSASIGLNATAIYLRLHQRKKARQGVTSLPEAPYRTIEPNKQVLDSPVQITQITKS